MLRHTFIHVPGIGYITEQKLWAQGFLSWEDYLEMGGQCSLSLPLHGRLAQHLEESARALAIENAGYFDTRLPAGEMWRLYAEFSNKVAFLDIETTGLSFSGDAVTMVGLFDGQATRVFIKGINLHEFAEEVKKYSLIVTFNGKRFDLPFLRRLFGELPYYQAHIDLLYPLRKLGYKGGLKSIEIQLGLERDGALKEVDGFLAVLLWREYQHGNKSALDTLIRYNLEDVVNLQYLAEVVYNEALARLPIMIEPLPVHGKYLLDMPFDEELINYLGRLARGGDWV